MPTIGQSAASFPVHSGPPQLSEQHKQVIHQAASRLVAAAVHRDRADLGDASLAGAADITVLGCFVTIRRAGRLRGCCGFFNRPTPLGAALAESATASATRDARLPSISPTELAYLDLKISLLHTITPTTETGMHRSAQVTVGRHGLQIALGDSRGLLLPSVAIEHGFTAEQFLQQVSMKAGLPPSAWKEDEAQLSTFETETFGGPLERSVLADFPERHAAMFQPGQLDELARVCRGNVVALMFGGTPSYYIPHCPDGNVHGITITVSFPEQAEGTRFSQLSIRPGLPLQTTLLELAKLAARSLASAGYYADTVGDLKLGLTVIYDPAMHGTVAQPDLAGINPRERAILVMENDRSAVVFDPDATVEHLLDTAASEAQVRTRQNATVLSLEATSTEVPVKIVAVPRPQVGPEQRAAAVAGLFYPADAEELAQTVDAMLAPTPPPKSRWSAALVPHAGLMYSGPIAASVLQRIDIPDLVLVLGPKHTRMGAEWAVAPHRTWSLPGISIASDVQLAQQLAQSIDGLELDAAAHAREHAIEIELPLLARLAPQARVVGIAIGGGDFDRCQHFAGGLAGVLRACGEPALLLISSDMNHFANDAETRHLDELALGALDRLDPTELFETVRHHHISMCGVLPAVIVLQTLHELGQLNRAERVAYATSADVTGDARRVVGYAGMVFGA